VYHYGRQSEAHEYLNGQCLHCQMYKVNVDRLSHVCTPAREKFIDDQYKERAANLQAGGVSSPTT
jgi:hypothetical protein